MGKWSMNFAKIILLVFLLSTLSIKIDANIYGKNRVQKKIPNFNYAAIELLKKTGANGLISSFVSESIKNYSTNQLTFWRDSGSYFNGHFLLINLYNNPKTLNITCLLDYKQIQFKSNGKNLYNTKIKINPFEEYIFPIEISNIPNGAHDFMILTAVDFDDSCFKNEKFFLIVYRANIFIKNNTFKKPFFNGKPNFHSLSIDYNVFKIKKKHLNGKYLYIYANSNNINKSKLNSVFIFFDDNFTQIGSSRFYELPPLKDIGFDFIFKKITNRKIFGLKIDNPFQILEPESNILAHINTDAMISNYLNYD